LSMAAASERMRQRFAELGQRFSQQLPERIGDLREAYTAARDSAETAAFQTVRDLAHRLAGTGATFGYGALSRDARLLETEAEEVTHAGEAPSDDRIAGMDDLMARIVAVVDQGSQGGEAGARDEAGVEDDEDAESFGSLESLSSAELSGASEQRAGGVERAEGELGEAGAVELAVIDEEDNGDLPLDTPVLYSNLDRDAATDQILEQLSFFGFEIRPLAELNSRQYSEEQPTAILLEAGLIENEYDQMLAPHREAIASGAVKLVCFSNVDTVEVRLAAVRAGAEAFVVHPVELVSLIDRLESFTTRRDLEPFHILLVDDDPEQVSHVALILQQAGMVTSVVTNPRHVFSAMIDSRPELILLDMYLGDCTGVELTRVVRQQEVFVGVPIVYLSVESDLEKQAAAIAAGADDFIRKPVDPERFVRLVEARCRRTRAMRYYMERDSLTGLRDHTSLLDRLTTELQRAARLQTSVSFAMIDLDYFKHTNDRYGHPVGDRVLKTLARLLQERLRKTDVVGRWGGEEFGVILLDADVVQGARLMDSIREQFSELVHQVGHETFQLTFSCGVAAFPDYDGAVVLADAADRALYAAKDRGRNTVVTA